MNQVETSNAILFWENGHYYPMSESSNNWHQVSDSSKESEINNLLGYLANITNSSENNFFMITLEAVIK